MRALIAKLSLAAVPFVLMVAVSYHVDPAYLFGYGPEAQIGDLMAEGHAVVSPPAVEPRLVQRAYVQHLRQAPEVIVFGSSRAMQIRSTAFPGRRVINTGVFDASIEDLVAMAGLYDGAGMTPREVVLDLDPWVLNKQNGLSAWRALAPEYGYMERKLGFSVRGVTRFIRPTFEKYAELVSPAYFQLSVPLLFKSGQRAPVVISDGTPGEAAVLLADGSRVEARVNRERSPDSVAQLAHLDIAKGYYVSDFRELDPLAQDQFERLVRYFMSTGVHVTLLLVPDHPVLFDMFSGNPAYRQIALQEEYFRAFAKKAGVPLLGSYDPAKAGCSAAEFFDGWHPRESCVNRVLRSNP